MIEMRNVSKIYKKQLLFKDVDLIFLNGKKYYIRGVNGVGKSVFLKLLVGYSTPSTGVVIADGNELHKDTDFLPNAGVFINAPDFLPNLTGLENLLGLASIRKIANKEKIEQLASILGFKDALMQKYKTYSLGMRQKMRIIQALMDDPMYLILDEPFDSLDKLSREQVSQLLQDYLEEEEERTLIYTSHTDSLEFITDEIYEISNYKIMKVDE